MRGRVVMPSNSLANSIPIVVFRDRWDITWSYQIPDARNVVVALAVIRNKNLSKGKCYINNKSTKAIFDNDKLTYFFKFTEQTPSEKP